jgi:hypothetical protein
MMETSGNTPPEGDEARWVDSQKGTSLLRDANNYNYRIHHNNTDGTKATYRCVKRNISKCPAIAVLHIPSSRIISVTHDHTHESDILLEAARNEEKKLITAAAMVGRISTVEVLSKIKTNLERSDHAEATSSMRKARALSQAVSREKAKQLGHGGIIPKTPEDIVENLPEKFKVTSTGGPFLRYMDFLDGDKNKLMLVFMSEHGAWALGKSTAIYCDGTFETCPAPFGQLYFILGQMGPSKRAIPCVFALLPDKEGKTYQHLWKVLKSLVEFEEGLPVTVMSDFEKAVLNTMEKTFPTANVRGCNFHHKQAIRRNIQTKGLQVLLNNSTKFMYFVKMLYGLSFVPPDKVTDIFENHIMDYLDQNKMEEGFAENAEEIEDFVAYFQRAWIGMIAGRNKARRPPLFSISTWNKYEDILAERQITNNHCEGVYCTTSYYLSILCYNISRDIL